MLFLLYFGVGGAYAATCNASDAPLGYSGRSCRATCSKTSDGVNENIECLPSSVDAFGDVTFYGATNYSGGSHDFSFWGIDGAGAKFCCAFDEVLEVDRIWARTAYGDDTIYLSAASGYPSVSDPGGTSAFDVYIEGGDGNNVIRTSRSASVDEMQVVTVIGDDDIVCYVNCSVNAGEGDDDVTGSDTFVGNSGVDTLCGGDCIFGESAGNDGISGGTGADVIKGFAGSDDLCGGGGSDDMYGGDNGDRITGGTGADYAAGENGSDQCSAETEVTCEDVFVFPPNECP